MRLIVTGTTTLVLTPPLPRSTSHTLSRSSGSRDSSTAIVIRPVRPRSTVPSHSDRLTPGTREGVGSPATNSPTMSDT